jgi:hypothetical protein
MTLLLQRKMKVAAVSNREAWIYDGRGYCAFIDLR